MTDKTRRVFNGWLALSNAERRELEDAIREYGSATELRRRQLQESHRDYVAKMETGPLRGGCPCCGR